jgi:hypothetical protein
MRMQSIGPSRPAEAKPRPRSDRRVLAVALLHSTVIHALILAVRFEAPVVVYRGESSGSTAYYGTPVMRAIHMVGVESRAQATDAPLRAERRALEITVARMPAAAPVRFEAARESRRGLMPRFGEARLWRIDRAAANARSAAPPDSSRAPLNERIDAWSDAVVLAVGSERRAMDWTRTNAGGELWGVRPGAIHLGGRRLRLCVGNYGPLECGFVASPGRRDEYANRIRAFSEGRRQAARIELDRTLQDRIRAIRSLDVRRDSSRDGR